jgi:hypothetical protein
MAGPSFPALAELDLLRRQSEEKALAVKRHAWQLTTLNVVLGGVSTALAASAAISVLADALGPWFTGITAGVAALITGIQTSFRPDKAADLKAKEHLEWEALVTDLRHFINVDVPLMRDGDSLDQAQRSARQTLMDFEDRSRDLKRGKLPEHTYRARRERDVAHC